MSLHPGYNKYDPDTIYHGASQKITFFYLPWSNDLLYDPDPDKTHEDMLQSDPDDQSDDWMFDQVYPDKKNLSFQQRSKFRSRGAALGNTNAILGRFGMLHNEMVIATWNPLSDPNVSKMLKKLYQTFPQLTAVDRIIVGSDKKAKLVKAKSEAALAPPQETQPKKLPDLPGKVKDVDGTFYINGVPYTYEELRQMRLSMHTGTYVAKERAKSVLCHPDMTHYPELQALRPSNCGVGVNKQPDPNAKPSRQTMRNRWAQASGMPLAFKYGESFRKFIQDRP